MKSILKLTTTLFLFGCLAITSAAQTLPQPKYAPFAPVDFPANAPAWFGQLAADPETLNFNEMTKLFNQYLYENPDARTKSNGTKFVVNFFRRWQKAYRPFVQPDGSIKLPTADAFREAVAQVNKEAQQKPSAQRAASAGLKWKLLTPLITYDWKHKGVSPAQSNVQRFDVSKSNPDILYCGTETSMIFKTTDKGLNWTACAPNHYFGGEVSTVEISPSNPDKVLVGAGNLLWLTTDGGSTWKDITPASITFYCRVRDAVFDPVNDNHFFMGNDKALYESKDNGATWQLRRTGQCLDIKYKNQDHNTLYVLQQGTRGVSLYKSTDGGENFEWKGFPDGTTLVSGRIGLSQAPAGAEYIYILGCHSTDYPKPPHFIGEPRLIKSTNGGNTWNVTTLNGTEPPVKIEYLDLYGGQGYYDMTIIASPSNPEHLLFGLTQLYLSKDGGATFGNIGGHYGKYDLHVDMQELHTSGSDTWLSTDGGIVYSPDFFFDTAEPRIKGIYASEFWGFDQAWNEDVIVGGRNHNGNMSQLDTYNGASISMKGSERPTGYVFLSNPRKIAYSDSENVIMPDDWHDAFTPFQGFWYYPMESTQYGIGFEFDPRYAKSFLMIKGEYDKAWRSLWKTTDDGESFVLLKEFDQAVSAHVISRSNPDKIVVGTIGKIYYSLDGGNSFAEYALPQELTNASNYKIAIHPRDENEIWVSTHNPGAMFRTTNNGATWVKTDKGLTTTLPDGQTEKRFIGKFFLTGNEKNAVYAIANISQEYDDTYTVYRGKIMYMDNTTDGWVDISDGLAPVMSINRMLPFYKDGKIRVATNNGVWERPLDDADFRPIAQPLILNVGTGENKGAAEIHFDSYSIVNQNNASWHWSMSPEPAEWLTSKTVRNPKVRIAADQSYHVTLTVTTPAGTDTKTVYNMIKGKIAVPVTGVNNVSQTVQKDISLAPNAVKQGEKIVLKAIGIQSDVLFEVFDAQGRIVHKQTLPLHQVAESSFDTGKLTSGVYYYFFKNDTFKKSGRFIVR